MFVIFVMFVQMDSKICLFLGITMFMLCEETQADWCPGEDMECNGQTIETEIQRLDICVYGGRISNL